MKFSEKNITNLHLGLTKSCALGCPGCCRNHLDSILQLDTLFESDIFEWEKYKEVITIPGIEHFLLCGNWGDPIYYKYLLELCEFIKQNTTASITMHTNGSYKTTEFWQQLGSILRSNDEIMFSIDGISNNFTTYRKNADWSSIEQAIKALTKKHFNNSRRANIVWKYLVFNYNIYTIIEAIRTAIHLRIDAIEIIAGDTKQTPELAIDWNTNEVLSEALKTFKYLKNYEVQDTEHKKWIYLDITSYHNVSMKNLTE